MAPRKGYTVQTGAQHRLNANSYAAPILPTVPLDHDAALDIPEAHFDALSVGRIEMWYGQPGLPAWTVPQAAGGGPPATASLVVGDAIQFRVSVFDTNGKGRWLSVGQLLLPLGQAWFEFEFMVVGAGLTSDENKVGVFRAVETGAPTVTAWLTLDGVAGSPFDTQTVTVTIT